jgi:hypothetical protein
MRSPSKRLIAILVLSVSAALSSCAPRPTTATFDPPYPETNANGDPILADFEGRIPCTVAGCQKLKVGLVLYQNRKTKAPSTYWLGLIGAAGDERVVTQGRWVARRGVKDYPKAVVYELDTTAPPDLRRFWRVSDDILLPLDQNMKPIPGDAAWGTMLSRYAEPYGPRTYQMQ